HRRRSNRIPPESSFRTFAYDRCRPIRSEGSMASTRAGALPEARRRVGSLLEEFRNFALKGNVVDLAVAVVIGAAFAKIIDSLVKHIIMPLVSLLLPTDQSYLEWKWVVGGTEVPYGLFIGEVVNFLIVALALFVFIVKFLG